MSDDLGLPEAIKPGGKGLSSRASSFFERHSLSVQQQMSLEFMPEWMVKNTSNPRNSMAPWSFEGHEFQKDIIASTSPEQSVKKCSQVGLSEVSARKAVCLAALRQGIQIIYTLPSGGFAQMFAKTRVDPIIKSSKTVKPLLDPDTDNTKLKKIGDSFIHFVGTYSSSAPISIPASYVISDEVDFSNQEILSDFASRMGHQKEGEMANIQFSTPTVDGYGVSASFEKSSKGRYMVRCEHCEKWSAPEFLKDVVVPGCAVSVKEMTRYDVAQLGKRGCAKAYMLCPNCRKDLTRSLLNPERRAWVHEHEGRRKDHEGFRVVPFDVPSVNPVGRTLYQMLDYKKLGSWYNYKLGETFSSESTSFNLNRVDMSTGTVDRSVIYNACIGIDVGKSQTWVSVGVPTISTLTGDVESLQVVELAVIDSTELAGSLGETILKLAHGYRANVVVCDAAPDFSTAQYLTKTLITGRAFGNYYVAASAFSKEMGYFKTDERKAVCLSDRTASIDELCEMSNAGLISYPACEEMDRVKQHLDSVKRLEPEDDEARWVTKANGDDHWVHSLNYLLIAAQISGESGVGNLIQLAPAVNKVKIRGGKEISLQ